MSRQKAAKIASLSDVDFAIYRSQRNQRSYWQKLPHDEWAKFCEKMAEWFKNDAVDEWDKFVISNNARKLKSDEEALMKKIKAKMSK